MACFSGGLEKNYETLKLERPQRHCRKWAKALDVLANGAAHRPHTHKQPLSPVLNTHHTHTTERGTGCTTKGGGRKKKIAFWQDLGEWLQRGWPAIYFDETTPNPLLQKKAFALKRLSSLLFLKAFKGPSTKELGVWMRKNVTFWSTPTNSV